LARPTKPRSHRSSRMAISTPPWRCSNALQLPACKRSHLRPMPTTSYQLPTLSKVDTTYPRALVAASRKTPNNDRRITIRHCAAIPAKHLSQVNPHAALMSSRTARQNQRSSKIRSCARQSSGDCSGVGAVVITSCAFEHRTYHATAVLPVGTPRLTAYRPPWPPLGHRELCTATNTQDHGLERLQR
jgi:hypothetical protein